MMEPPRILYFCKLKVYKAEKPIVQQFRSGNYPQSCASCPWQCETTSRAEPFPQNEQRIRVQQRLLSTSLALVHCMIKNSPQKQYLTAAAVCQGRGDRVLKSTRIRRTNHRRQLKDILQWRCMFSLVEDCRY